MNDRIDDLARHLAAPPAAGRRAFLRRAAAILGVGATAFALPPTAAMADEKGKPKGDDKDTKKSVCPPGTVLCGTVCRVVSIDPDNCGACGTACPPGQLCRGGVCGCPAGTTLCNGQCRVTSIDPDNCGACGTVCPPGHICRNGTCVDVCTCGPACIADGQTSSGSFGNIGSQVCIENLVAKCCRGKAVSGSCSCNNGVCSGSVVCASCIPVGQTSSGSFGNIGSQVCVENLVADCCSGTAASGSCSCNNGVCSGSVVCAA
jgi:Stigma-specific protein, Stig1